MKNIQITILLFFCLGCTETDIENDLRIFVRGKVLNENIPLQNATIEVSTEAAGSGAGTIILGNGTTNTNGDFEFVSLYGQNDFFEIEIKRENEFEYTSYTYRTNTLDYYPEDLTIDLGTIELKQISDFNYNINRNSPQGTTLEYTFTYTIPSCEEYFEAGILDPNQSFCLEPFTFSRTLDDNNSSVSNDFLVPLGSIVEFSYSINGGTLITELITVDQINFDYDFSY